MRNFSIKSFISGILVCCLIMGTTVFAAGTTKTIKAIFSSVTVEIDGKAIGGDKISYNGNIFVSSKSLSEFLQEEYSIDKKGNVSINKKVSKEISGKVEIKSKGTYINDGKKFYFVSFSDGVTVLLPLEVNMGNFGSNQSVFLGVEYNGEKIPQNVTITGFNKTTNKTFPSIPFAIYSTDYIISEKEIMKMDFYENFKNKANSIDGSIPGIVLFDSSVDLEGIKYDDGVHICELYFDEDKIAK